MDKMEHFRGAKLMDGKKEVLADLEGYIGCHEKGHGRRQWHGYFELTKEQHITAGVHLLLVLPDARVAEINAADIQGSDMPGKNKHVAEFYVIGELRVQRRGHGLRGCLGKVLLGWGSTHHLPRKTGGPSPPYKWGRPPLASARACQGSSGQECLG